MEGEREGTSRKERGRGRDGERGKGRAGRERPRKRGLESPLGSSTRGCQFQLSEVGKPYTNFNSKSAKK